jgi:hypothetical protein
MKGRIRDLYEKTYIGKFLELFRSFGDLSIYKRSCGCNSWVYPEMYSFGERVVYRQGYEYGLGITIGYSFRIKSIPCQSGLICKINYGSPSKVSLDLGNGVVPHDGLYFPTSAGFLKLNGVSLNFLMIDRRKDGHVGYDQCYMIRLYFQIDVSKEMQIVESYHLIYRLRRNQKSLFSTLPKELIKLIQGYLISI